VRNERALGVVFMYLRERHGASWINPARISVKGSAFPITLAVRYPVHNGSHAAVSNLASSLGFLVRVRRESKKTKNLAGMLEANVLDGYAK
jgi:hypothetical protein